MPAILTDCHLCSPHVPASWSYVLDDLRAFIDQERLEATKEALSLPLPPRLVEIHNSLVERSVRLLEPRVLAQQTAVDDLKFFVRAALMLLRLNECVAADTDILDTAGSKTLAQYSPDLNATQQNRDRLLHAIRELPGLSNTQFAEIERQVEEDVEDARRKQRVVRAIREEFGLSPGPGLRDRVFRFFQSLYPDAGLKPDDVELIVTGAMIFFCIPFRGTELHNRNSETASEDEAIQNFLKRVGQFSHWQFAHFPVFGFLRGESLSEDLKARLSQRSGLPVDQVAWEISRLTAIVPLDEVDKFVVHDVWGHGWQASMLHFDRMYEQLASFADPIPLDALAEQNDQQICFAECFPIKKGQATFSTETFRRFVTATVSERLPVAMTPVLAEILADVTEFKLISDDNDLTVDTIPNSSLLKHFPCKLDLIVQDLKFYFSQATKSFRLWAKQPRRQATTVQALVAAGATEESAATAVAAGVEEFHRLAQDDLAAELVWRSEGQQLHVNMFTRVALNFLGIHRATLTTYESIQELDVRQLPLQSFRDLLLITAAVYFEADPQRNLWRVDEFLTLRIEPLCEQLARHVIEE